MTDTVARDEITGLWRVTKPGGRGPYAVVDTEPEARAIAGCMETEEDEARRLALAEKRFADFVRIKGERDRAVALLKLLDTHANIIPESYATRLEEFVASLEKDNG